MRGPLNLATRPVRNERLPALVFVIAALAMFLVTVQHAFIVYHLMPGRSKALREEVTALRKESEQLDLEKARLARLPSTPQLRTEWSVIRNLVDRRTFWWSKLFEVLEKALPFEVRLVSVTPRTKEGKYHLDMVVRARSVEDGFAFVKELERRDEFEEVVASGVSRIASVSGSTNNEVEVQLTMRYLAPAIEGVPTSPAEAAKLAAAAPAAAAAEAAKPKAKPTEREPETDVAPEAESNVEGGPAPREEAPQ
jgi:Tfp pilus assembly protein PilN